MKVFKMWSRSNWCERTILLCSISILTVLILNASLQRIYLSLWLALYSILLIVSAVWLSCVKIRILLVQNAPYGNHFLDGKLWKCVLPMFPKLKHLMKSNEDNVREKLVIEDNFALSSTISSVIERKYIWSWYSQFVSKEIAFPFGCKELLDQMVIKIFQVSTNFDLVHLSSDSLGIILRHCKEYKRALKRFDKFNKGQVEDYYKHFHPTSNHKTTKEKSSQNHCFALTKTILKELLPWELWDTPHAMLLSSILAKRLDNFINNSLSDPKFLRYWIKHILSDEKLKIDTNSSINNDCEQEEIVTNNEKIESIESQIKESSTPVKSIESALSNMMSKSGSSTPKLENRNNLNNVPSIVIPNVHESKPKNVTQPINIDNKTQNGFNSKNEVKIYDRVIEGSLKTWNSDVDLECVSLGHDLLASLDGEMGFKSRLGRLWEADNNDTNEMWSPNHQPNPAIKTPQPLWFGEEDNIDMDLGEDSPPKNVLQQTGSHQTHFNMSKPLSIQNIKELQHLSKNTVNQAKHKMGGLQDEAAGVMEGILDLGIAGFKKLRLPGIQDTQDAQKVPKSKNESQTSGLVAAVGQVLSTSRKNSQTEETLKCEPKISTEKDNEGTKSNQSPHLPRQQNVDVPCLDAKEANLNLKLNQSPIDNVIFGEDSPDYEYEETEDLPSTIAKLRSLLQQKTENVTITAEEALLTDSNQNTKRNQNGINEPMSSVESENEFSIISPNISNSLEAEDVLNHKQFNMATAAAQENNIQRLDKLFTRTVTGVFNTIKTAVGGDSVSEAIVGTENSNVQMERNNEALKLTCSNNWTFVEGEEDLSVLIGRLLVERRGYCVVEAAQDSLDMINILHVPPGMNVQEDPSSAIQDELDESELAKKCPLWQMFIELISVNLGGALQKDAVIKSINVTFGETGEKILEDKLTQLSGTLKKKIINEFEILSKKAQESKLTNNEPDQEYPIIETKDLCDMIFDNIPGTFSTMFGNEEVKAALENLITSIEYKTINRDVVFNLLDMFVLHFLRACVARPVATTPPPSA